MGRRTPHPQLLDSSRWWLNTGEALTSACWGWVERLRQRQKAENLVDLIHEAIYEGRPLGASVEAPVLAHLRPKASSPANLNITRSMVDTVVARLGKRRPMPVISADDAGWSEKLFAKRASRTLRRKMGKSDVERLCPQVLRDAVIRGTGVAKVFRNGGDVSIERVPRHELVLDPREARYGTPRVMAQVKQIHRDVLAEMFPDDRDIIAQASRIDRDEWSPYEYDSPTDPDHIEVVEAWHLPSGPHAKDGRHIIAIRGYAPLLCEDWTRARFPFAWVHWSPPVRGVWGHGLVEDLTGIQAKVNDLARDIQDALYFGAMLKVFVQRSANVNKAHLRARHPVVIETDGPVPNFVAPTPVSPQQIQFMEFLIQQAFQISGISQASASSKNPLGSNASGKALDTMYDLESDRFSHVELQYAMFRVDIGALVLDEARDLAMDKEVPRADKAAWINEVEWKKVTVDEGDYHLILEPINFLPESRAGRLSTVKEMSESGLITNPLQAASLFDEPDIARANRHLLGPYRNLERVMEQLSDPDAPLEDLAPDPHWDLSMAKDMALGEYNQTQAENAPEEVLGRFRWFLTMVKGAEDEGKKGAAAAAPPMPGAPGPAGPMGPPGMAAPPLDPTMMAPPGMPPMGMA